MAPTTLKTAAVAAAAALTLTGAARADVAPTLPGTVPGVNNVTSVTTKLTSGTVTTVANVTGAGASYSPFTTSNKYTVNYGGSVTSVLSMTAGGTTYDAFGMASNVVRRFVGENNDMLWFTGTTTGGAGGTGTGNGATVNLNGPNLGGFSSAFLTNDLSVGADNLFVTKATAANPVGNNTNVDRVDLLFNGGFTTSTGTSFLITDRGESTDHDSFAVAAITSLDANGDPATYGPLLRFTDGTWGTTALTSTQEEVILRKNNNVPGDTLHPSDYTDQTVGGVAITTAALDGGRAGQTIYGYSLFSPDLAITGDGSGTQLADYTNGNVYLPADDTSTGGGLDPAATIAVLFSSTPSVPEPTTAAAALLLAGAGLLGRRRAGKAGRTAA